MAQGIVNTGRTWENLWTMQLTDNIKDIKFAPKFFGLAFATATANGEIRVFTPIS
jgi:hypothetical protein